jgi:hypothetical protein
MKMIIVSSRIKVHEPTVYPTIHGLKRTDVRIVYRTIDKTLISILTIGLIKDNMLSYILIVYLFWS